MKTIENIEGIDGKLYTSYADKSNAFSQCLYKRGP